MCVLINSPIFYCRNLRKSCQFINCLNSNRNTNRKMNYISEFSLVWYLIHDHHAILTLLAVFPTLSSNVNDCPGWGNS